MSGNSPILTKTEMRKIARRARQHGYYRRSETELAVDCPQCRERVECHHEVGQTTTQCLDGGMLDHLQLYCGQE